MFEFYGCACERVVQDYGEDVLVQSVMPDGEVDPFRILIQVKGTDKHFGDVGEVKYRVSGQHIRKWSRCRPSPVFVYWSVAESRGYYAFAVDARMSSLRNKYQKFRTMYLYDELNSDSIGLIIWRSRTYYYNGLVCEVLANMEGPGAASGHCGLDRNNIFYQREFMDLGLHYLYIIGLLDADYSVHPNRFRLKKNLAQSLVQRHLKPDFELSDFDSVKQKLLQDSSTMLYVLGRVHELYPSEGLPGPIWEASSYALTGCVISEFARAVGELRDMESEN